MRKKLIYMGICFLTILFLTIAPMQLSASQGTQNEYLKLLTEEEKEFLMEAQAFSVIVSARKGPIQYVDQNGNQKGISKDLLDEISRLTGLNFEYITMDGMEEIRAMINSGEAQIVSGVPPEATVEKAYDISFSSSYLDCSYGIVLKRGDNLSRMENMTLALTAGLDVPGALQGVKEVKHYNSIQECLKAVNNREADFTYGNSYVLEFYSQGYELQSLCVIPLNQSIQNICFGVSRQTDERLLSILNKALDYLGPNKILDITVTNVAASIQPINLPYLISANPGISLLCCLLLLGLMLAIAILVIRNYKHKGKLALMEHQRYLMVSAAAKDYFFEYSLKTDTLTLSSDMAELFGSRSVLHKWKGQIQKYAERTNLDADILLNILEVSPDERITGQVQSLELKLMDKDAQMRWYRITRLAVYEKNRISSIVGKLTDIQAEYDEREKLMIKSLSDSMTGLYNAAAVKDLVGRLLKSQRTGSFFIIDLDYFKNVNDQFGHQKGDEVLISFANILKTVFRSDDIVGRIGGDEFAIFAKDATGDSFISNKCHLIRELAGKIPIMEGYVQTISIGVAKASLHSNYEGLFHDADVALYAVKKSGRDGYRISEGRNIGT